MIDSNRKNRLSSFGAARADFAYAMVLADHDLGRRNIKHLAFFDLLNLNPT